MRPSRYALFVVAALAPGGCMLGPTVGQTVADTDVSTHTIGFTGLSDTKSSTVTLSVYTNNSLGPLAPQAYSDLTSTQTSSTAGYLPTDTTKASPFYQWGANVNPSTQFPGVWPQGGVIRVKSRSKYNGNTTAQDMYVFDDTFAPCESANYNAGSNWVAIGEACASPYTPMVATVLSTTPTPAQKHSGAASELYLGQRGGVFPTQPVSPNSRKANTTNYYSVTGAEADLPTFKSKFGFGTGGDEASAIYYNYGDLGLGRDMHCRSFTNGQGHTGKACYVTNYGRDGVGNVAFGQDPDTSINQAIAQSNPIATVAMVYDPDNSANMVRFVVFDGNNARSNFAALDNGGLTAIKNLDTASPANITVPDNCLTCHGIGAKYAPAASGNVSITAARFLAFDPFNVRFSTQNANYADAKMLPVFNSLNGHVMATNPSTAQKEFLNGMYAPKAPGAAGAVANTNFVPTGWSQFDYSTRIYNEVVKPYCRTCHMSQQDSDPNAFAGFDWATYTAFTQHTTDIGFKVCGTTASGVPMPQSERTQTLLWQSPARAHLLNGLDIGGPCSP